jgi:hypothetical protein
MINRLLNIKNSIYYNSLLNTYNIVNKQGFSNIIEYSKGILGYIRLYK